jgi:hypothetical protein
LELIIDICKVDDDDNDDDNDDDDDHHHHQWHYRLKLPFADFFSIVHNPSSLSSSY